MNKTLSLRLAAAACGLALLPSCSYRVIDPAIGDGQRISVPTTVNDSRWRGVESDATQALRRNLQQQFDVELSADSSYKYVLRTKVTDLRRGAGVNNVQGGTTLGVGRLTMEWTLELATGEVIRQGKIARDLEFLTTTEESTYSAIEELLQEMAEQISMEIGSGLDAASKER